jgi:hypothetical protein
MDSNKAQGKNPYRQPQLKDYRQPQVKDYGNIKVITGAGPGSAKKDSPSSIFTKS